MTKKICVIGAGASGLVSIKESIEVGFSVTCYERSEDTGGLWRYHEEDVDGIASVTRATIINSSKEVSAFSDFPPPPELPNYCHNSQLIKYFDSYVNHHGLRKYIRFKHSVLNVQQTADASWLVKVLNHDSNEQFEETFDAVMVATGHHIKPHMPTFQGLDKFKGKIIHTHSYKRPDQFKDQRVLIIGIGNSGGDAAVELSSICSEVYLSTRTGAWVLSRVYKNGMPMDFTLIKRSETLKMNLVPYALSCWYIERELNSKFDHQMYGLKPKHRVFSQHPFVNDALPNRILSGTVRIKKNVIRFTEDGVIFEDSGDQVTPIDSVVFATGYETHFPFISQKILDTSRQHIDLYKYCFCPSIPRPESLMFVGLIQPFGPLIPISEIQARWFCQLQLGRVKLPSEKDMMKDIEAKRQALRKRYYTSPRHTMQVDFVPFMDEIAQQFGAKPNLLKYFFSDPVLWNHLMFGPNAPYVYRLDGPGKWKGARDAILGIDERTKKAFE